MNNPSYAGPDRSTSGRKEDSGNLNSPVITFIERKTKPNFMRRMILSSVLSTCLVGISFTAQALADEQTFIQKAATNDQTAIILSQLAVERASSPEIKQFAQTMVMKINRESPSTRPISR